MGVAERRLVDVEVQQPRPFLGVPDLKAQLLLRFAASGGGWGLTGVDVPSGLHPAAEALVEVEDRAAGAHHQGRRGEMGRVGVLVGGIGQPVELEQFDVRQRPRRNGRTPSSRARTLRSAQTG